MLGNVILVLIILANSILLTLESEKVKWNAFKFEAPLAWKGMKLSEKYVKEGKYSGKWDNHKQDYRVYTTSFPSDWSKYKGITFWIYSEKNNNAKIMMVLKSDNPETKGIDYYRYEIKINWKGWKKFKIPFANMKIARKPIGWSKITAISFESKGWGCVPKDDTVLYFDDMKLINKKGDKYNMNSWKRVSIPDLKNIEHPYIISTKDDITKIKNRIKEDENLNRIYIALKKSLERKIKKKIKIPDTGGAWIHGYVCKRCGSRLIYISPHKHKCPKCGIIYSGYPYDAVPYYYQHMDLAEDAYVYSIIYLLSGDKRFGKKAKEILMGYANKYESYKLHTPKSSNSKELGGKAMPQTLDESIWVIYLIKAYDGIYNILSKEERKYIENRLFYQVLKVIVKNKDKMLLENNWQSWHNAAKLGIGLILRDRKIVDESINKKHGFFYQLANNVKNGMWFEGTWGYHFYAAEAFIQLSEMAYHAGINLYKNNKKYKEMFLGPIKASTPDGFLPRLNDSHRINLFSYKELYKVAAFRWKSKVLGRILMLGGSNKYISISDLISSYDYGMLNLITKDNNENEDQAVKCGSVAVLKTGNSINDNYVAFKYNNFTPAHFHPDILNIIFYSKGKFLAPGPGSCAYGSPYYKTWYKQTIAHNCITVNEKSQDFSENGKLKFLDNTDFVKIAIGEVKDVYSSYEVNTMIRKLFLTKDYLIVMDNIVAKRSNIYDWVYHNNGKIKYNLKLKYFNGKLGKSNGYQYITDIYRGYIDNNFNLKWNLNGINTELYMIGEKGTEVIIGKGFAPINPNAPKRDMVLIRRKGNNIDFATILEPYRENKKNIVSIEKFNLYIKNKILNKKGNIGIKINKKNGVDYYIIAEEKGLKISKNLEGDGDIIIYSKNKDKKEYFYLRNGKEIKASGIYIKLDKKGNIYFEKVDNNLFYLENKSNKRILINIKGIIKGEKLYKLKNNLNRDKLLKIKNSNNSIEFYMDSNSKYELTDGSKILKNLKNIKIQGENKSKENINNLCNFPLDKNILRDFNNTKRSKENIEIKIEAENFVNEGDGKVYVCDKAGVSGKAIKGWDNNGQWIEWKVKIPKSGVYQISVKYATKLTPLRMLVIDGKCPGNDLKNIVFPYTGGWGSFSANDWIELPLLDKKGNPYLFYLKKGVHTLRLINNGGGGVNLDYIKLKKW